MEGTRSRKIKRMIPLVVASRIEKKKPGEST